MNNSANKLIEGLERLGLVAARIRKNEGIISQIEIDVILQELRSLYMLALQQEVQIPIATELDTLELDLTAAAQKAAEDKAAEERRMAEEAAAKKAAEEKRLAEKAAAKKAAEERRMAEEAAAKKAAEEKRMAEEAAAKKAAELAAAALTMEEFKPVFAPAEPTKKEEPIMEPIMEHLAGNPNDELFAEEPVQPVAPAKKEKPRETSLFDFINSNDGQPKRTLADTLGQHTASVEQRLENRVNAKKVDDLRPIISINDKFIFMSELFHNNMKAYNDFILRLNATSSREEALEYVATISKEYNWKEDSSAVMGFWKIFDRKF
ncbi:MAG: hypothetical protein KBT28_03900 [Bacteroidales bacterium]|nr:hypothetical protein [Candidatus Colimorpha merdihippi]